MGGRYIFPYVLGEFLSLSGGTVTGDTIYTSGLSGNTLYLFSGFTFNNGEASENKVLSSIDDYGNATWKSVNDIFSDGQNTFVTQLSSSTIINLVNSPSVENFFYSGTSYGNNTVTTGLTAQTIEVSTEINPTVDDVVDLGTTIKRFRNLNIVNGIAVNFTATTINLGNRVLTPDNIVLTGDTIDSGLY